LSIPRLGCINLHCSYLPEYAGLLPSFWALYHQEKETGVTVHYMDDKIDSGAILSQARVPIDPKMTMFELVQKTKRVGGDLVCQVISRFRTEKIESKENRPEQRSYHSWPTLQQMKEFRLRGGKLI
jgi:methionyl-tRNA formyltransferase